MSKDSVLKKIRAWMENEAIRDELSIKTLDKFPSLKEARVADAKNYRAMIKDINSALADNELSARDKWWITQMESKFFTAIGCKLFPDNCDSCSIIERCTALSWQRFKTTLEVM